jgi:hypothetical protein
VYEAGSQDATAAQSPASARMAFWCAWEAGLETESRIPPAKCWVRRAWVIGVGVSLGGEG